MKWHIKSKPKQNTLQYLMECLGVDEVVATLLAQRGINNFDKAKAFFRPHLGQLHDPFLMQDMDKAVERVLFAINSKQSVMVFGDYDVDGTTSVAMLTHFLRSQKIDVTPYVPDRYTEGYGLSMQGIDVAHQAKINCIIALDCGIKAIDQVAYASSLGIDIIICDHHTPGEKLPKALAVLDPKRNDCAYPYKELCGCGVGLKLIQGIVQKQGNSEDLFVSYLDFVSVAIAADIVPITGENRALAFLGLHQLNTASRPGLNALMQDNVAGQRISNVVFGIAPRINAAGRMKHGLYAVELLLAESEEEATYMAQTIEAFNTSRRSVEQEITKEALAQIEEQGEENKASTIVYAPHWHKGVIGIVASRLIESYYRPTLVFTKASDGILAASARSVHGIDIYEAILACNEHLIQFGGHKHAAGVTIKESQYADFKKAFEAIIQRMHPENQKEAVLDVDTELTFTQITPKLLRILKQMEPFGPENRSPVFYADGVKDTGFAKCVGSENNHLKARFVHEGSAPIEAIGFGLGHCLELLQQKKPLRIAFTLEENSWQGNVSIQLRIKDIQLIS